MGFFDTIGKINTSMKQTIERRKREIAEIERKAAQGDPDAIRKWNGMLQEEGRRLERELEELSRQ